MVRKTVNGKDHLRKIHDRHKVEHQAEQRLNDELNVFIDRRPSAQVQ